MARPDGNIECWYKKRTDLWKKDYRSVILFVYHGGENISLKKN